MQKTVLFIITLIIYHTSFTQQISTFVPNNHFILDSTSYDYNNDQIPDIFLICKHMNEENLTDSLNDFIVRPFIILEGKKKNKYRQVMRNDSLILCYDCGGVFGDPFDGISLNGDTLILGHYGGSTWKWTKTGKYLYKPEYKEWIIIEYSESDFNSFDYENTLEKNVIKYYPEQIIYMKDYDIYNPH